MTELVNVKNIGLRGVTVADTRVSFIDGLELGKIEGLNLHPELEEDLFKLILDKNYEPFASAIKLAETQKILFQDCEGEYLFDKSLLEKTYNFDKIRVENTLQVILNEIKWQRDIVTGLHPFYPGHNDN